MSLVVSIRRLRREDSKFQDSLSKYVNSQDRVDYKGDSISTKREREYFLSIYVLLLYKMVYTVGYKQKVITVNS